MKKREGLKSLLLSAIVTGSALVSGCATWPTPVKVVATPVAVVRDVVDLPFATMGTGCKYVARATRPNLGRGHTDFRTGASVDITSPFFYLLAYSFGVPDYVISRSFVGGWKGVSPFKKGYDDWGEFYFPNTRELWGD
jgi:hypothetical protein